MRFSGTKFSAGTPQDLRLTESGGTAKRWALLRILDKTKAFLAWKCADWIVASLLLLRGSGNLPDTDIVVNLTTYPKRLLSAYLAITSLFIQSARPKRIILWVAESEFEVGAIELRLHRLISRGLEIEYVVHNIRSYKKLIPALRKYPDLLHMTVDDDIFYARNLIEMAWAAYQKDPNHVIGLRCHKIKIQSDLLPYSSWEHDTEDTTPSHCIFPTGMGGVLYPKHCFDSRVTDSGLFMKLCPEADDVWFKCMATFAGIKARKISCSPKKGFAIPFTQSGALWRSNVEENGNDAQIGATLRGLGGLKYLKRYLDEL